MVHTRTGQPWPPITRSSHVGFHLLDASSSRPRHEEKSSTSYSRQICLPRSTLPLTQWRLCYFPASPILRGLRSGLVRQHRLTHFIRDSRWQAVPNQLVVVLRTQLLQNGTMMGKCMAVVAGLGFIGMHRYEHYLPSTSNHFIRAVDVTFEYIHVDTAGASSIATAPTESIHEIPKDKIVGLTYFVPHSKTDRLGTGTYSFVRRLAVSELVVLDIVGDIYEWCCIAKPSGFEPSIQERVFRTKRLSMWRLKKQRYL